MILVTGAGSFLGKFVLEELKRSGQDYVAIFRRRFWSSGSPGEAIHFDSHSKSYLFGDLTKTSTYQKLAAISRVIHLAASTPRESTEQLIRNNAHATHQLTAYASSAWAAPIVFTSAVSAYGEVSNGTRVTPSTPSRAPGIYGASKLLAEEVIRCGSVGSTILRLPGIIGPGSQHNWLSQIRNRLARNDSVAIYNPHAAFNNVVHVADLARFLAFHEPRLSDHVLFPVGTASSISVMEVVLALKRMLNSTSRVEVRETLKPSFSIDPTAATASGFPCSEIQDVLERFAAGS